MKVVNLGLAECLDDESVLGQAFNFIAECLALKWNPTFDVGSGLWGTIAWHRSFLGTGA